MFSIHNQTSQTALLNPFDRLSYDIWLGIMQFAISGESSGPLTYLAVSNQWEKLILETPALWSTILLDNGEDEAARVQVFLHLSARQLVDIIYITTSDRSNLELVLTQASRIRSFTYSLPPFPTIAAVDVESALATRGRLYSQMVTLSGFSWAVTGGLSNEVFTACPHIRRIPSSSIPFEFESALGPELEEVQFKLERGTEVTNLARRKALRTLTLHYPHRQQSRNTGLEDERLDIEEELWCTKQLVPLSRHIGEGLTSLTLEVPTTILWAFLPSLSSFKNLSKLCLTLDLTPPQDHRELSLPFLPHPRINKFLLKLQTSTLFEEAVVKEAERVLNTFTDAYIMQYASILHLDSLRIPIALDSLLPFIHSTSKLRELKAWVWPVFEESNVLKSSDRPALTNLTILHLSPPSLLQYLTVPNVIELRLYDTGVVGINRESFSHVHKVTIPASLFDDLQPIAMYKTASHWSNLTAIKLTSGISPQHLPYLPSIRSIEIACGGQYYSTSRQSINHLLHLIVTQPKAYPQLNAIQVNDYPPWELLFKALRKRNSRGAAHIKKITSPALPSLPILDSLVRLLRGEENIRTKRNIDRVISKRLKLQHTCIRACTLCIEAGYIHCIGQSAPHRTDDTAITKELTDVLSFDTTPETGLVIRNEDEEPSAADIRRPLYWETIETSRSGSTCKAQLNGPPVVITAHTLDGMTIPPWLTKENP